MPRNLTATTLTGAMAHNLARMRTLIAEAHKPTPGGALQVQSRQDTRLWAVVKANAYGHGLLNALQGFAAADGMALLEFEGARLLRERGWTRPVLMLEGPFDAGDVRQAAQQQLTLAISQPRHLQWIAAAGQPVQVYLKINTGLNRLGLKPDDVDAYLAQVLATPGVRLRGMMTHFANADTPGGALQPLATFDTVARAVQARLPARQTLEHCVANSAALFTLPQAYRAWARPGIALYGASPFAGQSAASLGLRPAMQLTGNVLGVQQLTPGEATGYGGIFVAEQPVRVGIVNCGYADGYPRVAPTGTPVVVDGVRTRTLGRVSMDMLAVDLTPIPDAGPGTPVELWGDAVSIDEVAESAGTLGYELMCAVAPRVRRRVV
mgnify:CR=1 FL=1